MAHLLDVSVDYLLGYEVPMRRTDREPPGELARAFVDHVFDHYEAQKTHQRWDGFAEVVGGKVRLRPYRKKVKPSDMLEEGERILNELPFHLQTLVIPDPQLLLQKMCDLVVKEAEAIEEREKEPERERVRRMIRALAGNVQTISQESGEAPETVFKRLLDAHMEPLDPSAVAGAGVPRGCERACQRSGPGSSGVCA